MSRLRDEIRRHGLWDKPMKEIDFKEIQALSFADCVIKETMRVTPSIPGCVRVAKKTFELGVSKLIFIYSFFVGCVIVFAIASK